MLVPFEAKALIHKINIKHMKVGKWGLKWEKGKHKRKTKEWKKVNKKETYEK
jgi:hypothetical protein